MTDITKCQRKKIMTECDTCKHRQTIPGDKHIACSKPDPNMTGARHGKINNWFNYPLCFDPIWKTTLCVNFEDKKVEEL